MRRRLVLTTALIALAAVLVLGVPLGVVESRRVRSDELARLEREADSINASIDDRLERSPAFGPAALAPYVPAGRRVAVTYNGRTFAAGREPAGAQLVGHSGAAQGARVTVIGPAGDVASRRRAVWLLVALLALAGTAAAAGLAVLQARRFARPLERLTSTSARLGAGDFSARSGPLGFPEFDRVGAALDAAAAQIAQLVGRQREFSANVSHQLRSPLTALRLRLEELEALGESPAAAGEVQAALAVADRLERTVTELLALARAGDLGEPRDIDLAELARGHAAEWRPVFARAGRELAVHVDGALPARVSAGGVAQALDVLLENALHHGAGRVRLDGRTVGGRNVLAVSDEGTGAPAADIFDRHVSTAASTGLGLPLARALVEADGGRLTLAATAPTRFAIEVPGRPAR